MATAGKLSVPDSDKRTTALFAAIADDEFSQVIDLLRQASPRISGDELADQLGENAWSDKDLISDVIRVAIRMYKARSANNIKDDEVLAALCQGMDEQEIEIVRKRFRSLTELPAVQIAALAESELTGHSRVLLATSILTDLRLLPILPSENDAFHFSLLVHQLKIKNYHEGETQDMYFAMDENDLAELKSVIDGALSRSRELRANAAEIKSFLLPL